MGWNHQLDYYFLYKGILNFLVPRSSTSTHSPRTRWKAELWKMMFLDFSFRARFCSFHVGPLKEKHYGGFLQKKSMAFRLKFLDQIPSPSYHSGARHFEDTSNTTIDT